MVVPPADGVMLSASNLTALDEAGLKFILCSRATKAPGGDLAPHFHWTGDVFTAGQTIDTITPRRGRSVVDNRRRRAEPVWNERDHPNAWRATWQYSRSRAARDEKTFKVQEARARAVVASATMLAGSCTAQYTTTTGSTFGRTSRNRNHRRFAPRVTAASTNGRDRRVTVSPPRLSRAK